MEADKALALAREARFQIHAYTKCTVVTASIEQVEKFAALLQQKMEAENAELLNALIRIRDYEHPHCTMPQDLQEIARTAIDRARSANDT